MIRPFVLAETNYSQIKDAAFSLAIIPWGATEAHNYHLPYGTDSYESYAIACEAARLAWENEVKSLVLPCVPFGVNTGQVDIAGTVNMYPSTQAALLGDILESIENWGIQKILLLNGHGGNDFKPMLREAGRRHPSLFLAVANWYQAVEKSSFFEHEGDHADEMETSLMLHIHPELVLPLNLAGEGKSRDFAAPSLNEKWAWSERKWKKVSEDTGIGNPKKATNIKGKDYFEAVSTKIGQLIQEIAALDHENPYT